MGVQVFPILNHLPPPSSYHPPESIQCTNPEHPVSCIEPGLAIRFTYDNIHVSIPFSQIIPPSPSPTESKRLFHTSVSLLLSHTQGYHYHLSKFHICVSILYWCFSFWLTSLCIIGSSFIHLIRTDSNVFINGWVILHCVYVPQLSYPFVCWWTSRLLPCPGYYKQSKMYLIEKAQRNSDVKGPWLVCFFILLFFSFSLFFKVYVLCCPLLIHFSHVWIFVTLWAAAHQAPLSIEFSQQEYWSGLPCPPPGDLPDLGIKPASPALQMDSLPLSHQGRT